MFIKLKRISSIVIITLIIVFSISSSWNISANSNLRSYYKYDASNGSYLDAYILSSATTNNNYSTMSNSYDFDNRVIDYSKSSVVKLQGTDNYLGTGFIVDDHIIATCAHCVYKSMTKCQTVTSVLLFDTCGAVADSLTPVEVHIPCSYINNNTSRNYNYDYALITVEENLQNYKQFNLALSQDDLGDTNSSVSVTGFPQKVNGNIVNSLTVHNKYNGNGNVTELDEYVIRYAAYTTSGNSGSPVYITENYNGEMYYSVIAIHSRGFEQNGLNNVYGTRITTDILKFYRSNPFALY